MHYSMTVALLRVVAAATIAIGPAVLFGQPTPATNTGAAQTVGCSSTSGQRQHCAAPTSAGVVLIRSTGSSACLLGKTWGYDDAGVWVLDGCGGEFIVAGFIPPQQPPRQPQPEALPAAPVPAPADSEVKARLDVYGFAMMDTGFQLKQNNPDWFDVIRPTKLPSYKNEFGRDGSWFAGVRQSHLGFKGYIPTSAGEIKTIFEFELFGTGADAGQTTFRLRHAWGELGHFGAGQTWSPFMDPDVFPNSVEYWGPPGMVFFRNVQARWTPWLKGNSNFMIAVERPGASADQGVYTNRIELQNIKGRFPMPDISSHLRIARDWGHIQVAGIFRKIKWDDMLQDQYNLDGGAIGWGVNVSSNLKAGKKDTIRLQVVYGKGIQNYMNDAPVDVGIVNNFSNPSTPILGKALPVLGTVAFLDHTWSDKFTSSIGYSRIDIDNTQGQAANAFRAGQYAIANLLIYPAKGLMFGPELQWGQRQNHSDGWKVNDYRVQVSVKYNFSAQIGGN